VRKRLRAKAREREGGGEQRREWLSMAATSPQTAAGIEFATHSIQTGRTGDNFDMGDLVVACLQGNDKACDTQGTLVTR